MLEFIRRVTAVAAGAAILILLSACWNQEDVRNTDLGEVSIGQQLIDLKRASETGAMSPQEYEWARIRILELLGDDLPTPDSIDGS